MYVHYVACNPEPRISNSVKSLPAWIGEGLVLWQNMPKVCAVIYTVESP